MKRSLVCALVGLLLSSGALADDSVIARIQMIQPSLTTGVVYVQLVGKPQLNGGTCPNIFFVGLMSDANFKTFVYSALLAAKASDSDIRLYVSGCYATYPTISGVEFSPRLP